MSLTLYPDPDPKPRQARFALAELQELAYRDHPEAMPWSPEDDIVVAVQRDALTAVRR